MAEGILKFLAKDQIDVYSAGTEATRVNPLAVKAMAEIGIDISKQYSKLASDFLDERFDYLITVCDNARDSCPVLPGDHKKIHWSLDDPSETIGSEDDMLNAFKITRDKLFDLIKSEFNLKED